MRGGMISPTAFKKYLARTSADGQGLTADEAKAHGLGHEAYRTGHIDAQQHGPGLGEILANPSADYGPADAGSRNDIDRRANRRGDRESKYSKQRTRLDKPLNASTSRVRAGSAHEHYDSSWYGTPARRQGG
jgi:hypothetical protein